MDDYEFESESYEEVEEDDVGHDESPQVITIVTALPSAGGHRPRTRTSLPDSGYEIDNVQSTVSANMLKILKKTFSIPNTVFLHLPQDNDLPISNSSIAVLRDHEADRVNTLFSVSEQDRDYRSLLDPEFLCRLGLSPSFCPKQGEMSRPKRKTPVDAQKELVRLAYEKKASKSPSTSRKNMDLSPVSSTVAPSVVLTPQVASFSQSAPFGQVSSFEHPMPFGQPTSFGITSQSPSLGALQNFPYLFLGSLGWVMIPPLGIFNVILSELWG
ncbi:hypothetical protein LWI29_003470 [Acer saccharum]|uniref:Uncharacterized protein n=1 Tax=Acer saccharum TaxID=4024 RepID=A0AA39RNU5_ACESA|nr:hypothetical protein LWI29_003470 [Acer saccharum]